MRQVNRRLVSTMACFSLPEGRGGGLEGVGHHMVICVSACWMVQLRVSIGRWCGRKEEHAVGCRLQVTIGLPCIASMGRISNESQIAAVGSTSGFVLVWCKLATDRRVWTRTQILARSQRERERLRDKLLF